MRIFWLFLILTCSVWMAGAADCPTPPTKPTKGVSCTDPITGYTITRVTDWVADGLAAFARNDYSRHDPFNSDKTRFIVNVPSGYFQLYNATTYARIKQLGTISGDPEIFWHPTDPTQFYYLNNNGYQCVIKRFDIDDDSIVTVANFAGRLPWPSATYCYTGAEGSPSANARYWGFEVVDSGFNMLGMFTYDLQTDTILGTLSTSEGLDFVSMTPNGDYFIAGWRVPHIVQGVEGRLRAYTKTFSDWTWIGCMSEHSDAVFGANGNDYYVSIDYSNGGDPNCSPQNGYIYAIDIESAWVSQGYATPRLDIFPLYGDGPAKGAHISGKATGLPGRFIIGTYGGTGNLNDRIFLANVTAATYTEVAKMNVVLSTYYTEPHAAISKDGSKIAFNSGWGNAGESALDVYVVDVSIALDITTTTLAQGTVGQSFPDCVLAIGGTAPRTFALAPGSNPLPTGLTLTSAGCFTGTFSAAGTYTPTFRVTDFVSATDDQLITWVVNSALQIDTTSPMPNGTVGSGYVPCLVCSGGTPPRTFSCCQAGVLPIGLSLGSNGCFTGTAQQVGTYNFTSRCTDSIPTNADKALQITIDSGVTLSMAQPIILPLATSVHVIIGAQGLPHESDCQATLRNAQGAPIESKTSVSGFAKRSLFFTGLTASTVYSFTFTCDGTQPDISPYPFVTKSTPAGGNRTAPIYVGAPVNLPTAARATVEYDDNEAMSTPASVQNTSCASGCTINLTIPAGQWWYRWIWQTSGDVTISSSPVIPLQVE